MFLMLLSTPQKIIYLFGESSVWSTFAMSRPGRGEASCSQVSLVSLTACPLSFLMLHLLTQHWGEVSREEAELLRA